MPKLCPRMPNDEPIKSCDYSLETTGKIHHDNESKHFVRGTISDFIAKSIQAEVSPFWVTEYFENDGTILIQSSFAHT